MLYKLNQLIFLSKYLDFDVDGSCNLKSNINIPEEDKEELLKYDNEYYRINNEHMFPEWESLKE